MLLLAGCMTMDGFFFAGTPTDAYVLGDEVIPAEQVEEVSFSTEDGATLYGVWAHQDDPEAQVYTFFHGNTGNIDDYWPWMEFYWSLGLEVFIFDYRGFGRSEGTPSWESLLTDGRAAVEHVTALTRLRSEDLVLHGLSLGGASALHAAIAYPPKVLITEDMFASGDDIIDDGSGQDLPDGWFLAEEWDNAGDAGQVRAPYLVLHAEDDTFVRSDAGIEVYAAANDPKALWLAPGCDHATIRERLPAEYEGWIRCWIAQDCGQ